jgi:hypothetical protein
MSAGKILSSKVARKIIPKHSTKGKVLIFLFYPCFCKLLVYIKSQQLRQGYCVLSSVFSSDFLMFCWPEVKLYSPLPLLAEILTEKV